MEEQGVDGLGSFSKIFAPIFVNDEFIRTVLREMLH